MDLLRNPRMGSYHRKKLSASTLYPVWENTRIVLVENREDAYRKAMRFSRAGLPSKTDDGEWRFAGISMLVPIYDKFEDGAEILWTNRGALSLKQIKKLVKSKRKLPVFDGREKR